MHVEFDEITTTRSNFQYIWRKKSLQKHDINYISLPLEFLNHPQNLKKFQGPSGRIFHYMEMRSQRSKKILGGKDKNNS